MLVQKRVGHVPWIVAIVQFKMDNVDKMQIVIKTKQQVKVHVTALTSTLAILLFFVHQIAQMPRHAMETDTVMLLQVVCATLDLIYLPTAILAYQIITPPIAYIVTLK